MLVQRTESAERVSTNNFYAWLTAAQTKDNRDNSFITLEKRSRKTAQNESALLHWSKFRTAKWDEWARLVGGGGSVGLMEAWQSIEST